MKPSLQFSIPCLRVSEEDGPPSFMHIFYELPFPEFPYSFPGMGFYVANGWCNGKGNFVQSMNVLKPDKSVLVATGDQPFALENSETPFMAVNLFNQVSFEGPGTYTIQIFLDKELKLEYPLTVRKAEKA